MSLFPDYEIIVTLGPASAGEAGWQALLAAGATGFRLNTSHLHLAALDGWLGRLEAFFARRGAAVPVTLDLQGSKWRLGRFPAVELAEGERVVLVLADEAARPGVLPVPHPDFFRAAPLSGGEAALNDARILLQIESASGEAVTARVTCGGPLAPGKGVTLTDSSFRSETIGAKDAQILDRARGLGFARLAVSYLRDAGELARWRAAAGPQAYLVAKLERRPAVDEPAALEPLADELWLCRGDLGAELGLAGMAAAAHRFAGYLAARARPGTPDGSPGREPPPALLAGQVLEHLTAHPQPTRAEVCGLYEALSAGYRGFVLSDETAVGAYPVEAVRAAAMFTEVEA